MRRLLIAAVFVLFAGNLSAQQTQVIDFDKVAAKDMGDPGIADEVLRPGVIGYGGMIWSGADVSSFLWWLAPPELLDAYGAPSDGSTVAYLSESTFFWFSRPGRPFTLNSFFLGALTSSGGEPSPFYIYATSKDGVRYSGFITASTTSMNRYDLGWADIEEVSITSPSYGVALIDNISITTATPEPSTLVLAASGFLGLAGVARRRRRLSV